MHGGEVTCEAMSTTVARSRRHRFRRRLAPAARRAGRRGVASLQKKPSEPPTDPTCDLNSKCRTTPKRTRPLSPRPPPNVIELPMILVPPRRADRRAVRNAQRLTFCFWPDWVHAHYPGAHFSRQL